MNHWYSIKAKNKTAELSIYGKIGDNGVEVSHFIRDLNSLGDVSQINLSMSSEGGEVQDAVAIHNSLKSHPAKVHIYVAGWALSAASYIAMAGDKVSMAENALFMIHNAWCYSAGEAKDLRHAADRLEKVTETMIDGYSQKTGKSRAIIKALLDAETWFTAQEALDHGFIDEIGEPVKMVAQFNFEKFNPPEKLKGILMSSKEQTPGNTNNTDINNLVIENKRREKIRETFSHVLSYQGMYELRDECEADPNCTEEVANQKILALMGKNQFSVNGTNVVMVEHDRMRDFKSAASEALLIRAGIPVKDPSPIVRDIQRMNVCAIAEQVLKMGGKNTSMMTKMDIIKAAHTTSDFPSILENALAKSLRTGYDNEPSTHTIWTGEREVADFKKQSLVALSSAPDLLEVKEAAEYKHGSFGESAESFSVKTYGRIFSITRQALINDDLGAFTSLPAAFGASARRLEADLVYAKLLSSTNLSDGNPLFHADHNNLASSGAALSIDSLAIARAGMRKQKGINGIQYIDPVPRFLIVPVSLETHAEQLVSSLVDPSKSNDTANVQWVRNLTVVADPRLDENSEVSWYLAASPSQIDGIVRVYLAGEDRPYYEVKDEFGRDVTAVKSRMDFAVAAIDFRAMYKNPGA